MLRIALATIFLTFYSKLAWAEAPSQKSPFDYRIKMVRYNPQDTVLLNGVAGIATQIVVGDDETYITHAFGDEGGWAFTHKLNHFFLKPKSNFSDTNLIIVTNKHQYNLLLHYVGGSIKRLGDKEVTTFAPRPWSLPQATVELIYRYPDIESRKKEAENEMRDTRALLTEGLSRRPKNFSYLKSSPVGNESIDPVNVWDDGRFTYFSFPPGMSLPTIFVINSAGKEATVNTTVIGQKHSIIVAQTIAREWRIRYGDKVIGIKNQDIDLGATSPDTGTASDRVSRVVKGGNDG